MDPNDLKQFKALFIETAKKHIASMQSAIIALQKNTTDPIAINSCYIAAHSLKGESLSLGHMSNAAVSQLLEMIFYATKEGKLAVTGDLLSAVTTAVNKLSDSIDSVEKEDKECVLNDERLLLEKTSGITLT